MIACLSVSIGVIYLGPQSREGKGEAATEHAPGSQIITGKCVLGGGFYCPSRRAGTAIARRQSESGGEGREMNVTLALICHIVNRRYEENASRLNVQPRHE